MVLTHSFMSPSLASQSTASQPTAPMISSNISPEIQLHEAIRSRDGNGLLTLCINASRYARSARQDATEATSASLSCAHPKYAPMYSDYAARTNERAARLEAFAFRANAAYVTIFES